MENIYCAIYFQPLCNKSAHHCYAAFQMQKGSCKWNSKKKKEWKNSLLEFITLLKKYDYSLCKMYLVVSFILRSRNCQLHCKTRQKIFNRANLLTSCVLNTNRCISIFLLGNWHCSGVSYSCVWSHQLKPFSDVARRWLFSAEASVTFCF